MGTKKKWRRISRTSISVFKSSATPGLYEASHKKQSGGYIRRRFNALSDDEAVRTAPSVLGLAPQKRPKEIMIHDALQMTLDHSQCGKSARVDLAYWGERFKAWLGENHPRLDYWHTLTPDVFMDYLASYAGRSANTGRHALAVLKQTARHMSARYGFANATDAIRTSSKLAATPVAVYIDDVVDFCEWLRRHDSRLEVGVALQGLAGLQLQEATRLTWGTVNLDDGIIGIDGEVKNAYRRRTIPVCNRVVGALQRALVAQRTAKVQTIGSTTVLVSKTGLPYAGASYQNYSDQVAAAMARWNPKVQWKPKDLRNAVQQFGVSNGINPILIDQYVGHAPRGIMAGHYIPQFTAVTVAEKKEMEKQMAVFRESITSKIDFAVDGRAAPLILKNFEPEGCNLLAASK